MQCDEDSSSSSSSDDDDDDDDDNEWQVMSLQGRKKTVVLTPRDDFQWHDDAILDCLQVTLDSHIQGITATTTQVWKPRKQESKPVFSPQPIPLPRWAVDPLLSKQQSEEHEQKKNE